MSPVSYSPETVPPIDRGRDIFRDFSGMMLINGGLILSKLAFREGVPEPLDWGNHAGNTVVTSFIVGYGWISARALKLVSKDKSPEAYRSTIKKGWMAAAAVSLAINVGVEYAPLEYREKYDEELTTTDPIDVVYGIGGGLGISAAMTARLKRKLRQIEEAEKPQRSMPRQEPEATPKTKPVVNVNRGATKAKRKIQQASRKKNRK